MRTGLIKNINNDQADENNVSAIEIDSPTKNNFHNDTMLNISSKIRDDEEEVKQMLREVGINLDHSGTHPEKVKNESIDLSKLHPGAYHNLSSFCAQPRTLTKKESPSNSYLNIQKLGDGHNISTEGDAHLDSIDNEIDLRDQHRYIFNTHEQKSFRNACSSSSSNSKLKSSSKMSSSNFSHSGSKPPKCKSSKLHNRTIDDMSSRQSYKYHYEAQAPHDYLNNASFEEIDKNSLDETK